jgi:hypothetical protein
MTLWMNTRSLTCMCGLYTESCPADENAMQAVYCGIFVGKIVVFGSNVPYTALESLLSVIDAELDKLSAQNVLRGVLRLTAAPQHNHIVPGTAAAQRRRKSVLSRHAMVGLGALLVAVLIGTVVVLRCVNEHMYTSKSLDKPTAYTKRPLSKRPHWALSIMNWRTINRTNDDDDATQATTDGCSRTSVGWFNDATVLRLPRSSSSSQTVQSGHSSWTAALCGPAQRPQKVVVPSCPYHEVDSIYIVEPDDDENDHHEPVERQGEFGADPLSLATQWPNHVVDVW